jgi:phosphoribosylaminoimidazole (AIR) synthetase
VGTKAKLALDWGVFWGLGQDLVAMNVNDLICVGADPMLFSGLLCLRQARTRAIDGDSQGNPTSV